LPLFPYTPLFRSAALLSAPVLLAAGCAARHPPTTSTPASPSTPAFHSSDRSSSKVVERLRHDLDAIFNADIMSHGQWAAVVRAPATGEQLYERNGGKLMMPASNMKIVTMAAAAQSLGWEAHFTTILETSAPIDAGILRGDLYVRGGGDPSINTRGGRGAALFAEWASALSAAGITRIDGRIVGDDNLFDDEGLGAGWSWDDLQYGYAAPVGALQYNEDVADLVVTPGPVAGTPGVVTLSPGSGLTLSNKTTTAAAGAPETIGYRRLLDRPVLEVFGVVPLRSPADSASSQVPTAARQVAVINPTVYFVQSLKNALVAHGIEVTGDAVDIDDLPAPPSPLDRRTLVRSESPPLREIGSVMMKVSQNLYADTLLKALGAAVNGKGAVAGGRDAVLAVLRDWKIDEHSLVMADGSGLSRYNYVTADFITDLLERMYSDPRHRDPFMATLAVAGKEGTVANRLRKTRAEGNARVKTGSISNMRALSGYVQTRDGETLAFSIIANDFIIPAATVNWITDLAVETLANFTRHPRHQ
jgi:D-alanyl-D-alanine carboxypeptidase/D-alanyl-D-alanine-endopeptidase (penicillin-binding protein 4)